jgi:hypothetical protein
MSQDKTQGTARILNAIADKQFVLADKYVREGNFEKSKLMNRLALKAIARANELKGNV